MEINFRVSGRIAMPVEEVFEAVADPAQLSQYFTTGGAKGRLETGATVMWDFHDFPGAFPVEVIDERLTGAIQRLPPALRALEILLLLCLALGLVLRRCP